MADRPLIMSAPMVRAILDGRKTQTRRLITPGTCTILGSRVTAKSPAWAGLKFDRAEARTKSPLTGVPRPHLGVPWVHPEDEAAGMETDAIYRVDPLIDVGDRLWVRETWATLGSNGRGPIVYRANTDGERVRVDAPWRSSIHLPRAASRLTLVVTDVRVERLQDISHNDAVAEGVGIFPHSMSAQKRFREIWGGIHGPDAWDANPWVAAVSFEVHRANIDTPSLALPASAIEGGTEP